MSVIPEVCGSIGPRIGADGTPRCGLLVDHDLPHRGFSGSGWESVTWGDPLMRDHQFVNSVVRESVGVVESWLEESFAADHTSPG